MTAVPATAGRVRYNHYTKPRTARSTGTKVLSERCCLRRSGERGVPEAACIKAWPMLPLPLVQHWAEASVPQRNAYIKETAFLLSKDTPKPFRLSSVPYIITFDAGLV
jgi:hypothetical protein